MTNIDRRGILPNVGYKSPVVVVTTVNITLSGGQVIGAVTVINGDRVLVNAQTNPQLNGLYNVNSAGTWVRALDFNNRDDVVNGVQILDLDTSIVYRAAFDAPWFPNGVDINFLSSTVGILPGGAGANDEVLFNNAGTVGSDSNFTWDGTIFTLPGLVVDDDATALNTRLLVYDVDNAQLERVSVGIADSGGNGFKLLRIAN